MKINKPVDSSCLFTGGHEVTPEVRVVNSIRPERGSEKVLEISQGGNQIKISLDTLASILIWGKT